MSKNTNVKNPMKVITGEDTRWSYANVWEPKSINGGTPKYSVSLIIPKSDTKTVAKIKAAIEAAYAEGESKLKGNSKTVPPMSAIKLPLRDGDAERPDDPAYAGCYFINANSATAGESSTPSRSTRRSQGACARLRACRSTNASTCSAKPSAWRTTRSRRTPRCWRGAWAFRSRCTGNPSPRPSLPPRPRRDGRSNRNDEDNRVVHQMARQGRIEIHVEEGAMKMSFERRIAAAAVAAALLAGGAACCSVKPSVDPNDVGPALAGEEKVEETGVGDRVDSTEKPAPEATGEQSSSDKATEGDAFASESAGKASESASPDPVPPAQEEPPKRWVKETEWVRVVDSPAWTESVPVYEAREISVCNVCGIEITGSVSAHAKEHMLAGEGSGHRSEVIQVLVGHEAVEHPEEGHWETVVTGGHWK